MDIIDEAAAVAKKEECIARYMELLKLAVEMHKTEPPGDADILFEMMKVTAKQRWKGFKLLAFAFDMGRAFEKSAIWPKINKEGE